MAELKPCPFCGAEMMYIHFAHLKYLNPLRMVMSCRCGAMMTADMRDIDEQTEIALEDYIIEKWNSRTDLGDDEE